MRCLRGAALWLQKTSGIGFFFVTQEWRATLSPHGNLDSAGVVSSVLPVDFSPSGFNTHSFTKGFGLLDWGIRRLNPPSYTPLSISTMQNSFLTLSSGLTRHDPCQKKTRQKEAAKAIVFFSRLVEREMMEKWHVIGRRVLSDHAFIIFSTAT